MKRFLLFSLVLVISLSLVACSNSRNKDQYTVTGSVTEDGQGISDVTLSFIGEENFGKAVTNDDGKWAKSGLSGEVEIKLVAQTGFMPEKYTVDAKEEDIDFKKTGSGDIPGSTMVLSGTSQDGKLIEVMEDKLIFDGMNDKLKSLNRGDIIIFGVTKLTPKGLLRRVDEIKKESDIIVKTSSATLEEAIKEGSFNFEKEVVRQNVDQTSDLINGASLATVESNDYQFRVNFNDVILYDATEEINTPADQIRINGHMNFNYSIDLTGSIRDYEIKQLRFENRLEKEERLDIQIGDSVKNYLPHGLAYEKKIKTIKLKPITFKIGVVPVVVTPVIDLTLGIDGDLYAEINSSITRIETINSGVEYDNGRWYTIGNAERNFDFQTPTMNANLRAMGHAGAQLTCEIYGVLGPYGKIQGFVEFDSNIIPDNNWKLYGGAKAFAGFEFEIMSTNIASANYKVINYRETLAQSANEQVTVSYPKPLAAGKSITFKGQAPADATKVIASVDGWPLTDEATGSSDIKVANGEYEFKYKFNQAGKDRRLVVNSFNNLGQSLGQTKEKITITETGDLDINYLTTENRELKINGSALPPIDKVIISVDGYKLTDAYGNSDIYVKNNQFEFNYRFSHNGENRRLVVNAFDRNGNSINQWEDQININ